MKKFNAGEVYNHTGKELYIKRRTDKSVWVSSGSKIAKETRKLVKNDRNGEHIKIDDYRTLFAGKSISCEGI